MAAVWQIDFEDHETKCFDGAPDGTLVNCGTNCAYLEDGSTFADYTDCQIRLKLRGAGSLEAGQHPAVRVYIDQCFNLPSPRPVVYDVSEGFSILAVCHDASWPLEPATVEIVAVLPGQGPGGLKVPIYPANCGAISVSFGGEARRQGRWDFNKTSILKNLCTSAQVSDLSIDGLVLNNARLCTIPLGVRMSVPSESLCRDPWWQHCPSFDIGTLGCGDQKRIVVWNNSRFYNCRVTATIGGFAEDGSPVNSTVVVEEIVEVPAGTVVPGVIYDTSRVIISLRAA